MASNTEDEAENIDLTLSPNMYKRSTAELVDEQGILARYEKERRIYQMIRVLGAGAMGEVHLVRDAMLRREIAYKQLLADMVSGEIDKQRFVAEVKITAQLDHPFIVPIYSLEVTDRGPAYTMKRVAGDDLKQLITKLKKGSKKAYANALPDLLEIFLKVCDALAFAHDRGIIHRDLKPANIMLGPFHEVYVMDWGIARPFGEQALGYIFEAQEQGKVIGTPRYMSPEQVRGANERLDGRSDLFALGLILFEILTLQTAYSAKNMKELLEKVRVGQRVPFENRFGLPIPRELQAIVNKATCLKRAERYETVQAMAQDIRRYLNDEAVEAAPDTAVQALVRSFKRHRVKVLSGVMGLVILSGLITALNLYQRQLALQAAHARELSRTALFAAVMEQGQRIDQKLLGVQNSLFTLAGHAEQALQHGEANTDPYYIEKDIDFYERVPNPFYSKHYNAKLSLDWPGFANAYHVPEAEIKGQLQRLNALHRIHRRIHIKSATGGAPYMGDWRTLIAETGVPLMFNNIVTKEGAYQFYPAIRYATPDYDPRTRPFYQQGLGHREARCGKTYLDRIAGQLMPCTLPIFDKNDDFMGIVAVDMQFNYLAREFLEIADQPAIRESYLLNAQGEIIVKYSDKHTEVKKQDKIHTGYQLKKFNDPELLKSLKTQQVGLLENEQRLLLFMQLNFQDWYFVAEVTPQKLYGPQ